MEREDFWGCQLTKNSSEYTFNVKDSELDVEHRLMVIQACLTAKDVKEVNIVQVTAADHEGKKVTTPIACLDGACRNCQVNLAFDAPVTFKLVNGSGPVGLSGTHLQSLSEALMDEESSDDEEEAPKLIKADKKRPLEMLKGVPSKKTKLLAESDEDSDDDSEEDQKNKGKAQKVKGKSEGILDDEAEESDDDDDSEGDEDEEDEEDDDEDEDEDDEDDDDEDESGEESSEDELTTKLTAKKTDKKEAKPKPLTNGAAKKGTPAKDSEKKGVQKDIATIKQSLLKNKSLPKSVAKFKNFMKATHKITEDKTVQDLWEWLQKSKK